jgi:hypothetical protein
VSYGGKSFNGPFGNALGGRIGCYKLRIGLLQGAQLGKELIVPAVADFGLTEDVIEMIVCSYLFAKLLNPVFYIFGHDG